MAWFAIALAGAAVITTIYLSEVAGHDRDRRLLLNGMLAAVIGLVVVGVSGAVTLAGILALAVCLAAVPFAVSLFGPVRR